MERVGIIDLGSNSVRLVIIDIDDNGAHHQVENLKESVRLVAGTNEQGLLSEESMQYAVKTIRLFVNFCNARRVDHILAVATAAVRRAANRQALVARIKKETQIEFRVLSGDEEAHLGYIGAVNTMPQNNGLMADLGGGSLKLVAFENRMKQNVTCQPFGVVTLTRDFQLHGKPSKENLEALEEFLTSAYQSIPWLKSEDPIIGLGGTFRSLARIFRKKKQYIPDITDGLEISRDDMREVYEMLSNMTLDERKDVLGMERARADLSVAGAATVYFLMKVSGRENLIVSTSSIRDGLLNEYLYRSTGDPIVLSVLTHHINNLVHHYRLSEDHLRRVSNLAVSLFDQLQLVHGLGSFERRLLLVAGLLHEIGVVISVEGRDKHTLYMLLNSRLHGLSHRERVIVAYLASSHDDLFLANVEDYILHGPLLNSDIAVIKKLAAILQVAHSLDRCHTGVVIQARATLINQKCHINVLAKADAELEINDARRKSVALEKQFGLSVTL